jgi:putative hydrolase of the HAD superfamily
VVTRVPRGVVLDLDDTLYLERDYVRSGFAAVARHVAARSTLDADAVADHLWHRFSIGERGGHFDDLVASDPTLAGRIRVRELVQVYREHVPDIHLLPGVRTLLGDLQRSGRLTAIISDGALASQRAKVGALGLRQLVDGPVILTDVWGRECWKPHPRAFLQAQQDLNLRGGDLVYVADNPHKDFDSPRDLGWACVRLRMPGQLHHQVDDRVKPDLTVRSVAALAHALVGSPRLT